MLELLRIIVQAMENGCLGPESSPLLALAAHLFVDVIPFGKSLGSLLPGAVLPFRERLAGRGFPSI
jgi:hypothetical protein